MSLNKKQLSIYAVCFITVAGVAFGLTYKITAKKDKPAAITVTEQGTKENPFQVALKKDNKDPVDLLIKTGDYVQFNSKDGGEHQIIQGKPTTEHGNTSPANNEHIESDSRPEQSKALDSGIIKPDEGYLLQFNKTGKYEFHDNYSHEYTITIIAYDPNKKAEDNKIQ